MGFFTWGPADRDESRLVEEGMSRREAKHIAKQSKDMDVKKAREAMRQRAKAQARAKQVRHQRNNRREY